MKVKLYNQEGEETGEVTLNKDIFGLDVNVGLIHQAVVATQANRRTPIAHTLKRGEVSTTTKKPHPQKHTGRARQGGTRNVQHRKGCVAFGPRFDRNFEKRMPKKQYRKALLCALSSKAKEGHILALEKYENEPKTKLMATLIKKLPLKKTTLIVAASKDKLIFKASANLQYTEAIDARNLSVEKVMKFEDLLILKDAFKTIDETFISKN
jgi:large subunit ribosomal protein L4